VSRPDDERPIALARPAFDEREEQLLLEVVRSGWVGQGPRVAEFERRFAERVGARQGVAVSSCTAGLFLMLHAHGIGPGDEVIVPSLSFIASANAITHCGAIPVFIDVEPRSYNIAPDAVAAAVGPRTRAVMIVHQVGLPADLDGIGAVAERHGVAIFEDAACALGASYKGRPIGGGASGHPACFSFHPRKIVVTGEGGMITTDDEALAARLRRLRHQGMSVSDLERHRARQVIIEEYPEIGYNFRMSDLHAALGLAQLAKLDELLEGRRVIAARYGELLEDVAGVEAPSAPDFAVPNHQSYLVRLVGADAKARNQVMQELEEQGISTRRGLMAIHRETPYRDARCVGALSQTELASDQTLAMPMHAGLDAADVDRVVSALGGAVARCCPAG